MMSIVIYAYCRKMENIKKKIKGYKTTVIKLAFRDNYSLNMV